MTVKKWSKIWKGAAGKTAVGLHTAYSERTARQSQVACGERLYIRVGSRKDPGCLV